MTMETPPPTPRSPIKCPDAPVKKRECDGCRQMRIYGYGGENQETHMGENGCLK